MERLGDIDRVETELYESIQATIQKIRKIVSVEVQSPKKSVQLLRELRKEVYEDINQLQHADLVLKTARFIEHRNRQTEIEWYWHPFQTGGSDEPDLKGLINGIVEFSIEVTTSESPNGTIRKRIYEVLKKLNKLEGQKIYVVNTRLMKVAAENKIIKERYSIDVINTEEEFR